jgi:hypothetical protein
MNKTLVSHFCKVKIPVPKTTPEVPEGYIYDPIVKKSRKRNTWEIGFEYGQEEVITETNILEPYYPNDEPEEKKEKEHFPFPISNKVYHFHPIAFVEQMIKMPFCNCPVDEPLFKCVKYKTKYGPAYYGDKPLATYKNWDDMINSNKITSEQKDIIVAMSENEGKMDGIQSYDSEIFTFGAMQKTVSPDGYGEFPIQVYEFKKTNFIEYKRLFFDCGWSVEKGDDNQIRMYYSDNGNKITGSSLKTIIREGYKSDFYKQKLVCSPLAHLIKVGNDESFQEKQILDFVYRLNKVVLPIKPCGYTYSISQILKSKLGKACVLDHHVNRPAHVKIYFGEALNRFYKNKDAEVVKYNKGKPVSEKINIVSRNPADWGANQSSYEVDILEIYGPLRGESLGNIDADEAMTNASIRYTKLKNKL